MPRKPKTSGGRPAQGVEAIAGQTYGRGVEQEELQRAMPAPDARHEVQQAIAAGAPGRGVPVPQPSMSFDQLLAAGQGAGQGAGLLRNPTGRPDEPLTAGLPMGRGPGPEILSAPRADPPGVKFLEKLSQATGDPYFAELARRGQR